MIKRAARLWLASVVQEEHHLRVMLSVGVQPKLPNLLRAFRDGKALIKGVPMIPDLGIMPQFDYLDLKSKDEESLKVLDNWLREQGLETSGVE